MTTLSRRRNYCLLAAIFLVTVSLGSIYILQLQQPWIPLLWDSTLNHPAFVGRAFSHLKQHYPIAIGIVSGVDWATKPNGTASMFERRQAHRSTWMQHPAVKNGTILAYFFVGNRPLTRGNPRYNQAVDNATTAMLELENEKQLYKDIIIFNTADIHQFGKMNAWYEWLASQQQWTADYHMKLDDESYLHVDRLLSGLGTKPRQRYFGGNGVTMTQQYNNFLPHSNDTSKVEIPWARGMGYLLSDDLMKDLGGCSASGVLRYNSGEHEDVYTGYALKVCNLTGPPPANTSMPHFEFDNRWRFQDLTHFLTQGCPTRQIEKGVLFHGGMVGGKSFAQMPQVIFSKLHAIYNYNYNSSTKVLSQHWESLRSLWMDDMKTCDPNHNKDEGVFSVYCRGWNRTTCLKK